MNDQTTQKTALRVYDPAMCCSTGVCGTSVDPKLAQFSADLDWLKSQGIEVERFNLAQQPGAFAEETHVKNALTERGEASLPLLMLGSQVVSSGLYPNREQLASLAGVKIESAPAPAKSSCCGPKSNCC
jgi:hypothetical protein